MSTNKVLLIKEPGNNKTTLEKEIDGLVYKLNDLTEEEIKLIEGVNNE